MREDGLADEVFSLIGPKRFDAPWKEIEAQGYIAPADCTEVRVTLTDADRLAYAMAEPEERYRLAATTPLKLRTVADLVAKHAGERVLVIGQYLDQLAEVGELLGAPVVTGETPVKDREVLFEQFRTGELLTLVVSKVANFSLDLPEAGVAVQISGTFGSRQEEAQRLGRILRPKADGRAAHLHRRGARHRGCGFRRPPSAVPGRAGLCLRHPGCRGPAGSTVLTLSRRPSGLLAGELEHPTPLVFLPSAARARTSSSIPAAGTWLIVVRKYVPVMVSVACWPPGRGTSRRR